MQCFTFGACCWAPHQSSKLKLSDKLRRQSWIQQLFSGYGTMLASVQACCPGTLTVVRASQAETGLSLAWCSCCCSSSRACWWCAMMRARAAYPVGCTLSCVIMVEKTMTWRVLQLIDEQYLHYHTSGSLVLHLALPQLCLMVMVLLGLSLVRMA